MRSRVEEDLDSLDLSPEQALIAAMLRHAVQDARSTGQTRSQQQWRANAQAWLHDQAAVGYWLEVAGLPAWTYMALLKEAGLEAKR